MKSLCSTCCTSSYLFLAAPHPTRAASTTTESCSSFYMRAAPILPESCYSSTIELLLLYWRAVSLLNRRVKLRAAPPPTKSCSSTTWELPESYISLLNSCSFTWEHPSPPFPGDLLPATGKLLSLSTWEQLTNLPWMLYKYSNTSVPVCSPIYHSCLTLIPELLNHFRYQICSTLILELPN